MQIHKFGKNITNANGAGDAAGNAVTRAKQKEQAESQGRGDRNKPVEPQVPAKLPGEPAEKHAYGACGAFETHGPHGIGSGNGKPGGNGKGKSDGKRKCQSGCREGMVCGHCRKGRQRRFPCGTGDWQSGGLRFRCGADRGTSCGKGGRGAADFLRGV